MTTPEVGKWYVTRGGEILKIVKREKGYGWQASNDTFYSAHGVCTSTVLRRDDLDMDRGPIMPTVHHLAMFALECLWRSHDDAGGEAFQWTKEEVAAVKEALVAGGRLKP